MSDAPRPPQPPAWLPPGPSEVWDRYAAHVESDAHTEAFAAWCSAAHQLQRAAHELETAPLLIPQGTGSEKANPLFGIIKGLTDIVTRAGRPFGLSPELLMPASKAAPEEPEGEKHGPDGDPATLVTRIFQGRENP